jgi:Zn-dependent peptidase ImmA (M78 family)
MPRPEVERLIGANGDVPNEELDAIIVRISSRFHVSREAAARRLLSLGYAKRAFYLAVREAQTLALDLERSRRKEEDEGGGGQYYYKRVMAWNGGLLCGLVLDAYHSQRISLGEAAETLRTKVEHLESIERELYG